jgi:hypothetical protein
MKMPPPSRPATMPSPRTETVVAGQPFGVPCPNAYRALGSSMVAARSSRKHGSLREGCREPVGKADLGVIR